ncbi:MAG: hypothetical protein IKU03_09725 [Bacteroidales bacterium]|nr:hypothetical protein [Bacteroidales bacterium]
MGVRFSLPLPRARLTVGLFLWYNLRKTNSTQIPQIDAKASRQFYDSAPSRTVGADVKKQAVEDWKKYCQSVEKSKKYSYFCTA